MASPDPGVFNLLGRGCLSHYWDTKTYTTLLLYIFFYFLKGRKANEIGQRYVEIIEEVHRQIV